MITKKKATNYSGAKLNKLEMYRQAMLILNMGTSMILLNNIFEAFKAIYKNKDLLTENVQLIICKNQRRGQYFKSIADDLDSEDFMNWVYILDFAHDLLEITAAEDPREYINKNMKNLLRVLTYYKDSKG
jgi:hypothetical protein